MSSPPKKLRGTRLVLPAMEDHAFSAGVFIYTRLEPQLVLL